MITVSVRSDPTTFPLSEPPLPPRFLACCMRRAHVNDGYFPRWAIPRASFSI